MKAVADKKFWLTPLLLLLCIVALHFFSQQHNWVEAIYSTKIYPVISSALRILFGWIPFSFGDIIYAFVFIWLAMKIIRFFRNKPTWRKFLLAIRSGIVKILWAYLFFLLMWGLNYYRQGIGYKLQLTPKGYSTQDLKIVVEQLRDSLNKSRLLTDSLHLNYANNKATLLEAISLYDTAKNVYPYLSYNHHSAKQMLSGTIGNYGGFLGYYNPFTGEAQVNTKAPAFIIPFTACHEIAHQLGYASESEASFVAYLVIKSNHSPIFNYSTYFDLFGFANGELYSRDSMAAKENIKLLDTLVKKDYAAYKQYLKNYENPVEPLLTKLYGNYLKVHNQPKGIESYDEIVAWIVAYYKKYGTF